MEQLQGNKAYEKASSSHENPKVIIATDDHESRACTSNNSEAENITINPRARSSNASVAMIMPVNDYIVSGAAAHPHHSEHPA